MKNQTWLKCRYLGGMFHVEHPGPMGVRQYSWKNMNKGFYVETCTQIKRSRGEWVLAPVRP